MSEPTVDPDVVIEHREPGLIGYHRLSDDRRWVVRGRCIWGDPASWGPCGAGSAEPPPGPPEGRLDIPVGPEFVCELCTAGGHMAIEEVTSSWR